MRNFKCLSLVILAIVLIANCNIGVGAKESKKELLKLLDVKLNTLSTSDKPFRKDLAQSELEAMTIITKEYNKLEVVDKNRVFIGGFHQSKYQSRKLLSKFKKDFSISKIPVKGMEHKFFNFKNTKVLTTEDYEFYTKFFKWHPVGKLTPYDISLYNNVIYFIDESKNFTYEARFDLNEKTGKIDIEAFVSYYYPTTPYIFFAGYMGYPDIPEASPDYK